MTDKVYSNKVSRVWATRTAEGSSSDLKRKLNDQQVLVDQAIKDLKDVIAEIDLEINKWQGNAKAIKNLNRFKSKRIRFGENFIEKSKNYLHSKIRSNGRTAVYPEVYLRLMRESHWPGKYDDNFPTVRTHYYDHIKDSFPKWKRIERSVIRKTTERTPSQRPIITGSVKKEAPEIKKPEIDEPEIEEKVKKIETVKPLTGYQPDKPRENCGGNSLEDENLNQLSDGNLDQNPLAAGTIISEFCCRTPDYPGYGDLHREVADGKGGSIIYLVENRSPSCQKEPPPDPPPPPVPPPPRTRTSIISAPFTLKVKSRAKKRRTTNYGSGSPKKEICKPNNSLPKPKKPKWFQGKWETTWDQFTCKWIQKPPPVSTVPATPMSIEQQRENVRLSTNTTTTTTQNTTVTTTTTVNTTIPTPPPPPPAPTPPGVLD